MPARAVAAIRKHSTTAITPTPKQTYRPSLSRGSRSSPRSGRWWDHRVDLRMVEEIRKYVDSQFPIIVMAPGNANRCVTIPAVGEHRRSHSRSPLVPLPHVRGAETASLAGWCCSVPRPCGRAARYAPLIGVRLINRLRIVQPDPSCKAPRPLEGLSLHRHRGDRMLDSQANRLRKGERL